MKKNVVITLGIAIALFFAIIVMNVFNDAVINSGKLNESEKFEEVVRDYIANSEEYRHSDIDNVNVFDVNKEHGVWTMKCFYDVDDVKNFSTFTSTQIIPH